MSEEAAEYKVKIKSAIETLIRQDRTEKRKLGLKFLESVILDVLRKTKHNGVPPLDAGKITRRAGIPFKFEYKTVGSTTQSRSSRDFVVAFAPRVQSFISKTHR